MSVSYWEFTFKDTPGDRKKGVPAEARKVSAENRRAVVTQLYMQLNTQYGWLWATGKKFNNSKILYAEHEVEEKSSKQGLRQLYPTSAQTTHFSQCFTNYSLVYFLGEIQKWLNFEMWILLFLNFLIKRTMKLFLERSSWNWTSQEEVVCSEGCPDHVCLPQPTSPSLSFLWKIRTLRKKEIRILVYSLALIHSFNNAMITYIPSYKVNSPIFTVSYCPFFPSM